MTSNAFIISARRSAVASRDVEFADIALHDLAAPVVQSAIEHAGIDVHQVDELIMGNALGAGGNPARLTALAAGLPETVGGLSIDRQCCSGLDALIIAKALIESGQANIVVAGGAESYSLRPQRLARSKRAAVYQAYDAPAFTPWPDKDPDMIEAASMLADSLQINRDEQNAFAVNSHLKAHSARSNLQSEIVPVAGLSEDTFTRKLSIRTCERAKTLHGSITTATTAVEADAAAFCIVVSESALQAIHKPVQLISSASVGANPTLPGLAPVAAINQVLNTASVSSDSIVVSEIMEAFAVQAMACIRETGLPEALCNISGGALARGHPIGASGAILAVRLYHELLNQRGFGMAAIAAAGGLGTALLLHS